jgi:hypothetical protein
MNCPTCEHEIKEQNFQAYTIEKDTEVETVEIHASCPICHSIGFCIINTESFLWED